MAKNFSNYALRGPTKLPQGPVKGDRLNTSSKLVRQHAAAAASSKPHKATFGANAKPAPKAMPRKGEPTSKFPSSDSGKGKGMKPGAQLGGAR